MKVKERLKLDILEGELGRRESQLKNLKKELSFYEKLSDANFFKGLIIWICRYPIFFLPLLGGGVCLLAFPSSKGIIFFGVMMMIIYFYITFVVYASERSSTSLLRRIESLEWMIRNYKDELEYLETKIKEFEKEGKI
ncbi:hypothetical protein GIX45_16990 [Erwinia sp. CPCC 100877]|nr:hypothetical protein [Erwinia sp. CPCC 100877]